MFLTGAGKRTRISWIIAVILKRGITAMPNAFTSLIALLILALIVLTVRFILKRGAARGGSCGGDCGSCGAGCASAFSAERKHFEEVMRERKEKQ